MMLGLDEDDSSVFDRTYAFIMEHRISLPRIHVVTPIPGTPLYERLEREGRITTSDLSCYSGGQVVFRPLQLDHEDLQDKYWQLYERLFTWRAVWHRIGHNCPHLDAYMRWLILFVNFHYRNHIRRRIVPGICLRRENAMRILLVRPPVPQHTMGLKHIMICEPLELEYVAAGLHGHEVQIIDLILERGFERRLRQFRPDLLGTSSYITGVNEVIKLCRAAKRWNRNVRTVIGGVHAACVPEDFADASVDCIALGDGTTMLPELLDAFASGKRLSDVPGLALPREGGVERTALRPYMPDPDTLPFPRREFVAHLRHRYYYLMYRPVATVKTTWGCWYRCNFCLPWQVTGGHVFSRSPQSIAAELEQIQTREIYIVDDIFLMHRTRLDQLARLLRERSIRKRYLVYSRADFVAENEDLIAEWRELGLRAVFLGLEAATDTELDSMDKRTSVDHNRRAVAVLRKHGIDTYASFVTQPNYTQKDWDRLQKFIDANRLYHLNISPLTPMPGTRIWNQYKDRLCVSRQAHGLWDFTHVLLPTAMPLKRYYRALLRTYLHASFNPWRFERVRQPDAPSACSLRFLRLWMGALRIAWQLFWVHRHHRPVELERAEDRGPAVLGSSASRN